METNLVDGNLCGLQRCEDGVEAKYVAMDMPGNDGLVDIFSNFLFIVIFQRAADGCTQILNDLD